MNKKPNDSPPNNPKYMKDFFKKCSDCVEKKRDKKIIPLKQGKFWCWHCWHPRKEYNQYLYSQCGKCGKEKDNYSPGL